MFKTGWILTLIAAAAVTFGAEAEQKAAEKKAEEKPAAKSAEINCAIPWLIPAGAAELKTDDVIKVPAEGTRTRATLASGDKLVFKLIDVCKGDPGEWKVCAAEAKVATVEQTGKEEVGWFSDAKSEFTITAVKTGRTLVEISLTDRNGTPIRMFRCYLEVK